MQYQNARRGLSGARYVPRISEILRERGLPRQLAYVPLIESGFRPHAVSSAGAVGPWQFLADTGRRYGLRIDSCVDERRDPVKSTRAAARYLDALREMFGNWHLALAAYNTGEGTIVRILRKGGAGDFWEMRRRGELCAETAEFVPRFLAALRIAETPEVYGFDAPTAEPFDYDLVLLRRSLSLATVARLSGTATSTIKELNPALHRGMVPPHGYAVRLPKGTRAAFKIAYGHLTRSAQHWSRHLQASTARLAADPTGIMLAAPRALSAVL